MPEETLSSQQSLPLNTTAYRIYKLLEWLREAPLSVEELNQRFLKDTGVKKALSNDSIWLYINTLKELGCEIRRPVPTTGFRYELIHHPFGLHLTPEDVETVIQAKTLAENHLSFQEILPLDRFFKKVLRQTSWMEQNQRIREMFAQSRSVDYGAFLPKIEQLQRHCDAGQLLAITYDSPADGRKVLSFLPETLLYQRGRLYLQGSQWEREGVVMLRMERILRFEPLHDPEIQEALRKHQRKTPQVVLLFPQTSPATFEPLGLGEEVQFFPRNHLLKVMVETRDWFVLKQKLLERSLPFEVLEPQAFQDEIRQHLTAMSRRYEDNHG